MTEVPIFRFALRNDLIDDPIDFTPYKAEPFATGWDVRAAIEGKKNLILRAGQYFKIPLGFRIYCPENWYYQLHPRSSSFTKKYMHNLVGIIDESWEGETIFAGQYMPDVNSIGHDLTVKFGDSIGQIIPMEKPKIIWLKISNEEMDDLFERRNYSRKSGGFGSTDFK
jgi:dUTPase